MDCFRAAKDLGGLLPFAHPAHGKPIEGRDEKRGRFLGADHAACTTRTVLLVT